MGSIHVVQVAGRWDTAVNVIMKINLWPLWKAGEEFLASQVILRFGVGMFCMKCDSCFVMWVRHRVKTFRGSFAASNFKYIHNFSQTVYHSLNEVIPLCIDSIYLFNLPYSFRQHNLQVWIFLLHVSTYISHHSGVTMNLDYLQSAFAQLHCTCTKTVSRLGSQMRKSRL